MGEGRIEKMRSGERRQGDEEKQKHDLERNERGQKHRRGRDEECEEEEEENNKRTTRQKEERIEVS